MRRQMAIVCAKIKYYVKSTKIICELAVIASHAFITSYVKIV